MEGEKQHDMLQNLQRLQAFPSPTHGSKRTLQNPTEQPGCMGRRGHRLRWGSLSTERERTWAQSQSPDPKDSCDRATTLNSTGIFTQKEMEHRGLIKNQLDIARECKTKVGHTHTEYQMERRKAEAFSPRAGSRPHPSYRRADRHAGEWESRSVTELEKKPDLPYLATVVPFLQITEVWKIN